MKMKKIYVAPGMEVMELNIETLMLSMSAPGGGSAGGDGGPSWGGSASDKEADANGRRGEWGNLWTQN